MAEIRISPDGQAVAIRSEQEDETAWNAWGVIHRRHGGHWSSTSELTDWPVVEILPNE